MLESYEYVDMSNAEYLDCVNKMNNPELFDLCYYLELELERTYKVADNIIEAFATIVVSGDEEGAPDIFALIKSFGVFEERVKTRIELAQAFMCTTKEVMGVLN